MAYEINTAWGAGKWGKNHHKPHQVSTSARIRACGAAPSLLRVGSSPQPPTSGELLQASALGRSGSYFAPTLCVY